MSKRRKVLWIGGGLVVVLALFTGAAVLLPPDSEVISEVSSVLNAHGFERVYGTEFEQIRIDLLDEYARFIGPHMTQAECQNLMDKLKVTGWIWDFGFRVPDEPISASDSSTQEWAFVEFGELGERDTLIVLSSSIKGGVELPTIVEVGTDRADVLQEFREIWPW